MNVHYTGEESLPAIFTNVKAAFSCTNTWNSVDIYYTHKWRGKPEGSIHKHGSKFFMHKYLEQYVTKFDSINEQVASVTLKLNIKCRLKIVQVQVQTNHYSDKIRIL